MNTLLEIILEKKKITKRKKVPAKEIQKMIDRDNKAAVLRRAKRDGHGTRVVPGQLFGPGGLFNR